MEPKSIPKEAPCSQNDSKLYKILPNSFQDKSSTEQQLSTMARRTARSALNNHKMSKEKKRKNIVAYLHICWYSSTHFNKGVSGTARTRRHGHFWHGTARLGSARFGLARHGTFWIGTFWACMARHVLDWHVLDWQGAAGFGLARYQSARHGMF